jgi:ABC-type lipoprotein export system ATPase subunit
MTESRPKYIEVSGLTCLGVWKIFQQGRRVIRALKDVSLRIEPGEMVCLTGPSGSGKSTLLAILGALDKPTKGEITAFGTHYGTLTEDGRDQFRRDRVGFVFQDLRLISHLTAVENVLLPNLFGERKMPSLVADAENALDRLGLAERLDHFPHELSYGEQQRVAFARALIRKPMLLLADEPTANLDDLNADRVVNILKATKPQGVASVVASHDPRILAASDRVLWIQDGLLSQMASTKAEG